MHISGTEPSSVIRSKQSILKVESIAQKVPN